MDDQRLNYLEKIRPKSSGLLDFDRGKFEENYQAELSTKTNKSLSEVFIKLLSYFLLHKNQELEDLINEDPSLIASSEAKSLRLLNLLVLKREIQAKDIFSFIQPSPKIKTKLEKNLAKNILQFYALAKNNLRECAEDEAFSNLDFFQLAKVLPPMAFYYSLFIFKNRITKLYDRVLEETNSNPAFTEIPSEKLYLKAFYYRLTNDIKQYQKTIEEYQGLITKQPRSNISEIQSIGNRTFFNPSNTFENWDLVLAEADQINKQVETDAALLTNTCEYFRCSDCCQYTYPVLSYTEFQYLKAWLLANNFDLATIKEDAKAIQEEHFKQHGSYLPIANLLDAEQKDFQPANPKNFKFVCPFLKDSRCTVHPARPLLCRGFGSATTNDVFIKSCNYYLSQYAAHRSPDNERVALDLRLAQMLAKTSDRFLTKESQAGSQELSATLPAWFSSDYFDID